MVDGPCKKCLPGLCLDALPLTTIGMTERRCCRACGLIFTHDTDNSDTGWLSEGDYVGNLKALKMLVRTDDGKDTLQKGHEEFQKHEVIGHGGKVLLN